MTALSKIQILNILSLCHVTKFLYNCFGTFCSAILLIFSSFPILNSPRAAELQGPVRLWAREWGRAGLPRRWHHHPDQPNWWKLVWGHAERPVRILPSQLRRRPRSIATLKESAEKLWGVNIAVNKKNEDMRRSTRVSFSLWAWSSVPEVSTFCKPKI